MGGGTKVPKIITKDGWRVVEWPDGFIEAFKALDFPSLENYTTLFGSYGGYQVSNIVLPYEMQDYQVAADVKIGTAFSMYAGANKSTGSFDIIMLATASGTQSVKLRITVAGYKK